MNPDIAQPVTSDGQATQATCVNCRFWERLDSPTDHAITIDGIYDYGWDDPSDTDEEKVGRALLRRLNARFGYCNAVNEGWGVTREVAETVKATVWDGSSYRASLNTRDDFSCALHESLGVSVGSLEDPK